MPIYAMKPLESRMASFFEAWIGTEHFWHAGQIPDLVDEEREKQQHDNRKKGIQSAPVCDHSYNNPSYASNVQMIKSAYAHKWTMLRSIAKPKDVGCGENKTLGRINLHSSSLL